MEIDEVATSGLDMDSIWELDIFFLEFDIIFFIHSCPDSMLIESAEYFFSLSLQGEVELLSIELFLYFKCLFESLSRLVLGFLFISFYLREAIWGDLTGKSAWYERVASLRCGDLDDGSLATNMGDI
jgi:hypothetical protein